MKWNVIRRTEIWLKLLDRVDAFGNPFIDNFKPYSPENLLESYEEDLDRQIQVFTGQTYDGEGEPADALLQVAGAAEIAEYLENQGVETKTTFLVADSDIFTEDDPESRYEVLYNFAEKYVPDYLDVSVEKSSDVEEEDEFVRIKESLTQAMSENDELKQAMLDTVPERFRTGNAEKDTEYTRHQLATMGVMNPDIKTGPERESLYDDIARKEEFMELTGRELSLIGGYAPPAYAVTGEEVLHYKARAGSSPRERILLGDHADKLTEKILEMPPEEVSNMHSLNSFLGEPVESVDELAHSLSGHFEELYPRQGGDLDGRKS